MTVLLLAWLSFSPLFNLRDPRLTPTRRHRIAAHRAAIAAPPVELTDEIIPWLMVEDRFWDRANNFGGWNPLIMTKLCYGLGSEPSNIVGLNWLWTSWLLVVLKPHGKFPKHIFTVLVVNSKLLNKITVCQRVKLGWRVDGQWFCSIVW